MTSQEESSSFSRFFQYVEDSGLRTYDGLVIQNASDISRESDRIRNHTNWTYLQEKHHKKKRQEEAIKRIEDDVARATDAAYSKKHFRMGFMTMPAPQDRLPPPSQGFSVRSQSLHSVGGGEEDSHQNRKQPPPKPRRDPNTKLSSSAEAVGGISGVSAKTQETLDQAEGKSCNRPAVKVEISSFKRLCASSARAGEDCRKLPPPKPKRNPNTQLSTSFDESYICNHGHKKPTQPRDVGSDLDFEEPVYIEMVGNILRELRDQQDLLDDEQSECVYEEMKYPLLEDLLQDPRLDLSGQTTIMPPESQSCGPRGSLCDIPPPFPNLLTPRPPLLVFPPAPAQCSPNSDESPLTPLDVTQLPVIDKVSFTKSGSGEVAQVSSHRKDRDRTRERETSATRTITASGRSSAPPLSSSLYKSSGSAHSGHGYPRSQSACPSPVSMSRCLTPLSLKRPPPYDTLIGGGSMPRSSSSSQRVQEGGARLSSSTSSHGSMQNISIRPQTPTSPLEDLNSLFTSSRAAKKKGCDRRRSRDGNDCRRPNRPDSKDRDREGQSSPVSSRLSRSSVSPTMMAVGSESKAVCKLGRSASTSGVPSPGATPQRQPQDHPVLSQMPWLSGDATMMEIIERKRILCREIKARQRPEKNLCKQESMPILPSWRRRQPPPYSAPPTATAAGKSTVFWDTAI
ncbi:neuronal tyrosine-phosphorylated phosphoinositide-3-kinase adapter 2 [Neosynchiropus ocellatus]